MSFSRHCHLVLNLMDERRRSRSRSRDRDHSDQSLSYPGGMTAYEIANLPMFAAAGGVSYTEPPTGVSLSVCLCVFALCSMLYSLMDYPTSVIFLYKRSINVPRYLTSSTCTLFQHIKTRSNRPRRRSTVNFSLGTRLRAPAKCCCSSF